MEREEGREPGKRREENANRQMKSIFLSDSDEEAIMEFVKQHMELYDKTNYNLNRQAEERKTLGTASSYQKLACQDCEEVVQESAYQIWQVHSDKVRASS